MINPTKRARKWNLENWSITSKNSVNADNDIAGILSKKEYWAASFLSYPENSAILIVDPERDTPGIIAKDWAIPNI